MFHTIISQHHNTFACDVIIYQQNYRQNRKKTIPHKGSLINKTLELLISILQILVRTCSIDSDYDRCNAQTAEGKRHKKSVRSHSPCTTGKDVREPAAGLYKRQTILLIDSMHSVLDTDFTKKSYSRYDANGTVAVEAVERSRKAKECLPTVQHGICSTWCANVYCLTNVHQPATDIAKKRKHKTHKTLPLNIEIKKNRCLILHVKSCPREHQNTE